MCDAVRGILRPMNEPEAGSTHVPSDDDELVRRAQAGERSAFDSIVDRHAARVWRVVWRILRSPEDTDDVVQEVFLTAYRTLQAFRGDAKLSTWLHRIAVTRALNHSARAGERMRRASEPLEADGPDAPAGVRAEVERAAASGHPHVTPLHALETKELMRRLADCLERLPAAWRAVIALRDAESLAYDKIATVLKIDIGTVRSRLSRARASLRECVEGTAA